MQLKRKPLVAATLMVMVLPAAQAAEPVSGVTVLEEVAVTATRTERREAETPATITSISREDMDRRLPADEADLFDEEPGVALPRDQRRHGATRVNIRGIEDNRVQQLVDGVRLPDYRNGGGPTNITVNTPLPPDTEFLKRVEILRGPASSLYGSDALGGVVGFLTLDPSDVLADDERFGARYKGSAFGANESYANAVIAAGRGARLEGLIGFVRRDGRELDNQGDRDVTAVDRTAPNPQDFRSDSLLAKFGIRPAAGHGLTLTLEGADQDTFTEVKRLSASLPKITAMEGDDSGERRRATLAWEHKPAGAWYDRLTARLYRQESETRTRTRQQRTNTSASCSAAFGSGNSCYVELDYDFTQDLTGTGVQAETGFTSLGAEHLLTFGVDLARTETEEKRDGRVWNLTTGTFTKSLAGETFPLRDFAPGHTDTVGLFVQDEIALGRLTLVPGLRYDAIRLDAEPDALTFQHAGRPAVDKRESALSPKLAARWQFTPATSLWAQVARGFRAPIYEEVNGSFRNTIQSYGVVPNPDLDPETSTGVELGLKHDRGRVQSQIAVFDNRYKDFIETQRLACPGDPSCIAGLAATFQSVNVDKVRIYGAEARAAWRFAPAWRASGAIAYARGHNETDDQPLNSIEPARATLAIAYDVGRWGLEGRVNAAAKVRRVDDTELSSGEWFKPDAWQTLDIAAWWKPVKRAQLNLAVNNVFDETYWLWGDVRLAGLRATDPGPEFYTQPGRNVSASFKYQF
ncbi:TonB-dependent receptor [Sulfurifustis variabilis]|uniref:TonB-dependent receptor n=1 Tax=Sulfurifustis variabilis TaxID=1675686 RepID=A0A1B4VBG1_9GAMM|nr:TonB-dependent hemoglobin/transferrin/lactoferrin family receptor [Sulfurifustis variabilis]BAU49674.1 TonB-dependent receptor [Sulfurifustis variabilis]